MIDQDQQEVLAIAEAIAPGWSDGERSSTRWQHLSATG